MASPATDRLVKAEVRFTWNNQQVENVLHFRHVIDSPDPTNMLALAQAINDSVVSEWLPTMTSSVTFREVYVEEYADAISQSVTFPGTGGGGFAGQSMPGNCALCVSLRTAFAGRSRRGRFYTIGMNELHQDGGVVSAAYSSAWLGALQDLADRVALQNWEWVIASFIDNGVPRPTGLVTPVTARVLVDSFVDSQRRRLQGRGR